MYEEIKNYKIKNNKIYIFNIQMIPNVYKKSIIIHQRYYNLLVDNLKSLTSKEPSVLRKHNLNFSKL